MPSNPILLFDGVCNFCAWSVRFVIDRDPGRIFRFASLQGDTGRRLLSEHGINPDVIDSVVLVEDGKIWRESDAALRVCHHLRPPWNWFWTFHFLPRFLRDAGYRFIARNRYRWFGRMESCMVPTPEIRARFLE